MGKIALFLGRFQPFHKGHEKALSEMLTKHANAVILIGSANKKRSPLNPYSSRERAFMARKVILSHAGWGRRVRVKLIGDREKHSEWLAWLVSKFPPQKFVMYSNNPLVRKLLAKEHYTTKRIKFHKKRIFNGTFIRGRILSGKKVDSLVPKAIVGWMGKRGYKIVKESG